MKNRNPGGNQMETVMQKFLLFLAIALSVAAGPETRPAAYDGYIAATKAQQKLVIEDHVWPRPIDVTDTHRVVFVCSAADSMTESLTPLKTSVTAALKTLTANQSFGLIFYCGDKVENLTNNGALLPANDANKDLACGTLEKLKPAGKDAAFPAIDAALKCNPDRIILVASAPLIDQQLIEERLHGVTVRIDTVELGPEALDEPWGLERITWVTRGSINGRFPIYSVSGAPESHGLCQGGPVYTPTNNARNVVFICNVTESMKDKLDFVKHDLQKSITEMWTIQSFNVIVIANGKYDSLSKDGQLLPVRSENKRAAIEFLDRIVAKGVDSDPIPAFELAFKPHPQLIHFITDHAFTNGNALCGVLKKLNADRKTRFVFIAVRYNSVLDAKLREQLSRVRTEQPCWIVQPDIADR